MYCKDEKATVKYKFGTQAERIYETDKTPISVKSYPSKYAPIINGADNYSAEGFWFTGYSPNNRNWISGPFHAFQIYPSEDYGYGPNYEGIAFWSCGANDWQARDSKGVPYGPGIDISTITVDYSHKCPITLQAKNRCAIEIKYNDIVIFVDQGECPCSFEVQCGDCPPGQQRIETSGYPGYCCLDCANIKSGIRNIKSILTSKLNS